MRGRVNHFASPIKTAPAAPLGEGGHAAAVVETQRRSARTGGEALPDKSGFRDSEARRRYLAVYDRVRVRTPPPTATHDVVTDFGVVRVYQHGPAGGVPLVALHCFWATSAMWAEHIPALTGDFTVYTVDMLGQPGASVQTKTMWRAADCARSINSVLDELSLDQVHLVGHSYGGWTALHTAAYTPHRLASATLIEPCNTVARLSKTFWGNAASLMLPGADRKKRTVKELLGRPAPGSVLDDVLELVMAASTAFASFGTPFPWYPADSTLRSVDVPVQVLLAGNTIHDASKGIDRMHALVPHWRHHLWPDATHMLPCEEVDEVSTCIRDFAGSVR